MKFKKARHFLIVFSQLSILSFVIAFGYILFPRTTYVNPSEWDTTKPTWRSDFRETTVWGKPFYFIVDNPEVSGAGRLSTKDSFKRENLLANWILWFIAVALTYMAALILKWITKRLVGLLARHDNQSVPPITS